MRNNANPFAQEVVHVDSRFRFRHREMNKLRAVFLDRDGVINVNRVDNVRTWEQFSFEDGSLEAFARLGATDFRVIVISNQSGIGRGHMAQATVDEIHRRMSQEVARVGGRIDRVYYCPHILEDQCTCRKPSPEMLLRGRDEFSLDLARSYFIGDWVDDIRAARIAHVTPLLVRTGRGESALNEMQTQEIPVPEIFENLNAAVTWILEREMTIAQVEKGT
jgi:D-glycero-D-manno-heptose 1,7-bisphosphate phosphatase